jgi:hypothetical protein
MLIVRFRFVGATRDGVVDGSVVAGYTDTGTPWSQLHRARAARAHGVNSLENTVVRP